MEDICDGGVHGVVVGGGCAGHDAGRGSPEEVVCGWAGTVAEQVELALEAVEVGIGVGEETERFEGGEGFGEGCSRTLNSPVVIAYVRAKALEAAQETEVRVPLS